MFFDSDALSEASTRRQELDAQRQVRYEACLQEARDHLLKFNQTAFARPPLEAAVRQLLCALEQKRTEAEPYAWLAYAMKLLGQHQLFSQYLSHCQRLDPHHPLVNLLY